MSETYTKLFGSITRSTIWAEDDPTRLVWITMLAIADQHGYVGASIPGLASTARVSIEATEAALDKFLSPDKYSRSQEFDGRRIEVADRGWTILNYERFRDMRDEEARKEYERNRKRAARKRVKDQHPSQWGEPKLKGNVPDSPGMSRSVPLGPARSAQAEASTEAEVQAEKKAAAVKAGRPVFKERPIPGYRRLKLFRFMVDEMIAILGDQVESFDLEGWMQAIDEDGSRVLPKTWPWLKEELVAECQRRGLINASGSPKSVSPARSAYDAWKAAGGCPHTPTCGNFTTCQVVSARKSA